jgi:hypothetical protein
MGVVFEIWSAEIKFAWRESPVNDFMG